MIALVLFVLVCVVASTQEIGPVNYEELKHNWCNHAKMNCKNMTSNANNKGNPCEQRILLLLMSEKSKAFTYLSKSFNNKGSRIMLLPNVNIIQACFNMTSSVSTFTKYTGDPFEHNPFDINDIIHQIQRICLKNLRESDHHGATHTHENNGQHNVRSSRIVAFPYRFLSFNYVKPILSLFPCTRIIIGRRYSGSQKYRSLKRTGVDMMTISPQQPEANEVEKALKWLGQV